MSDWAPYLWHRAPLKNIKWIFYRLRRGIENLIAYTPVIWWQEEFDHSFLLELMEFKMKRMADFHRDRGITDGREQTEKELRQAAELCRRISKEDYPIDRWIEQPQVDLEVLCNLMRRKLRTWWD